MDMLRARIFLEAISSGSLSQAARHYRYTPSGVSHMMDALESEVGFSLLIRTRKGVAPTPNAERLIPLMRDACNKDEQLSQAISEVRGLATGTLRIAAYASMASRWLPKVIASFHRDYPQIRIDLFEGVWQEVASYLSNQKADIGFYSYFPTIPYRWVFLKKDPMVVAVPPNHRLAERSFVRLEELVDERLIFPAYGSDVDVLHLIEGTDIKADYQISTLYNYSAFSMVEEGLGIVITNRLITEGLATRIKLLPFDPPRSIDLGVAIPEESERTPAVRRFVEHASKIVPELP